MSEPHRYNDDDIRAIIQRALEKQGGSTGDLSHADLLGIGEQIGVSAEAIEHAAHEVREERRAKEATARIRSSRRRWLAAHAGVFAVINGLLFAINALTTPGEWWFLFSAVFWGLALAAHSAFALGVGVSDKSQQRELRRMAARRVSPQLRVADDHQSTGTIEEPPLQAPTASRSART
jgi:hypothetical protein